MDRTVLLTAFEPFGGHVLNSSQEIVRALDGRTIAGHRVVGAILPCVFRSAPVVLRQQMRRARPAVVVCLGQADTRSVIGVERIAINVRDARLPDNEGAQPVDLPVVEGSAAAYWSSLPIKAIVAALVSGGYPAEVSQTAGTFVCNQIFYLLLHILARRRQFGRVRGGMIHVPLLAEQEGALGGWTLAALAEAISLALEVAILQPRDRLLQGGTLA